MKIFFSHSSSDKALVREIKAKMYSFLDIWLDEKELTIGENLIDSLNNSIKQSDLVILFLSEKSVNSEWVKKEIDWALETENKINQPFIMPILIEKCEIPTSLEHKLYYVLRSQSESDVNHLATDLNQQIFHHVTKYSNRSRDNVNYVKASSEDKYKILCKKYSNYTFTLSGKIKVPENFEPFRIDISHYDIDNAKVFLYPHSINQKNPFYASNENIFSCYESEGRINPNEEKRAYPTYDVSLDGETYFDGFIFLVELTNLTNGGEDILIYNKLKSKINRVGDVNRLVAVFSMGEAGEYIKIDQKISLEEGNQDFKFQNADYITLRPGEKTILQIPYIVKQTGRYELTVSLGISYASAKGTIDIELPNLLVPQISAWIEPLGFSPETTFESLKNSVPYYDGLAYPLSENSISWSIFNEGNMKNESFDYSKAKLSQDDIQFLGKTTTKIFRNDLFAKKGIEFESDDLNDYFINKYPNKKKTTSQLSNYIFTEIEQHNIDLSIEIKKDD